MNRYLVKFTRAFLSGPLAGMEREDYISFKSLANARACHREMMRRLNKPQRSLGTNDMYANTRCWVVEEEEA
jgi:hypothetical protein